MASERPLPLSSTGNYIGAEPDEPTFVMPVVRRRRRRWLRWLFGLVLVVVLVIAAAGAAFYLHPPFLAPVGNIVLGTQSGTVAWNGTDALNILVMGIDQRTTEPPHTDSMIVLHVDPASHDVTMLSVPRDLYVDIPNYGYYKINAAYTNGYNAVYAAQGIMPAQQTGAQFAQLTVENILHIPINYYAVIKFSGFKSVVDAMGGVTVCVPHEINDPTYPADVGYGYMPLHIKAGCQQMDGTTALEYARERHVDPEQDLGRIQQQQALLAGIEKQFLSPGTLLRAPRILPAVDSAVITNLPHSALPELGLLLGRAKGNNTRHAYINADGGYVSETWEDGQDVLAGNWPKINTLVSNLFADPQLRAENATVQVRNGQHTTGLAALYTSVLQSDGFNTVAPRDADVNTYQHSVVIVNQDHTGADYTARKLAQLLQAPLSYRHIGADHAQVVAILGADAAEGS